MEKMLDSKKYKIQKTIVIIVAILGVLNALKLTQVYLNANFIPEAAPSFCSISETIDCDGVAKTAYSAYFGIPLAIYGLGFYLAILFFAFMDRLKKIKPLKFLEVFKNPNSYIFSLSVLAVIGSIALAYISSHVIYKICLLCYFTYLLNILLFVFSKQDKSMLEHIKISVNDLISALKDPFYRSLAMTLAFMAFIVLYTTNTYGFLAPQTPKSKFQKEFKMFKKNNYKVKGNILGDPRGRVILHEYTDFQCPFCAVSNSMVHKLANDLDNILIIHHDFPLDKDCNKIMKNQGHKNSCLFAKYSKAAKLQGKYWDFNSALFDQNEHLTEEKVLQIAESIGLDVKKLKTDAYSQKIKDNLQHDINKAADQGLEATPSYRLGIKFYEGLMSYPDLKTLVIQAGATPKENE